MLPATWMVSTCIRVGARESATVTLTSCAALAPPRRNTCSCTHSAAAVSGSSAGPAAQTRPTCVGVLVRRNLPLKLQPACGESLAAFGAPQRTHCLPRLTSSWSPSPMCVALTSPSSIRLHPRRQCHQMPQDPPRHRRPRRLPYRRHLRRRRPHLRLHPLRRTSAATSASILRGLHYQKDIATCSAVTCASKRPPGSRLQQASPYMQCEMMATGSRLSYSSRRVRG